MNRTARVEWLATGFVAMAFLGGLVVVAVGAAEPKVSPSPQSPASPRGFIARFDRDGDGKVAASEFEGPAEHFACLDKNGDGFVEASEAPAGPPRRRVAPDSAPDSRGKRVKPPTPAEEQARFIARLDRDGDGRVSASEFDGSAEHFRAADANGDGFLEASEAPRPPCLPG